MNRLTFERLRAGFGNLTTAVGQFYAEAASVTLEIAGHEPGVTMPLSDRDGNVAQCVWLPSDKVALLNWLDKRERAEFGACAVALLAVEQLFGLVYVNRSWVTTGYDYVVAKPPFDPLSLFPNRDEQVHLEVSGICDVGSESAESRLDKKVTQVLEKGAGPRFIAFVTDFRAPKSTYLAENV